MTPTNRTALAALLLTTTGRPWTETTGPHGGKAVTDDTFVLEFADTYGGHVVWLTVVGARPGADRLPVGTFSGPGWLDRAADAIASTLHAVDVIAKAA